MRSLERYRTILLDRFLPTLLSTALVACGGDVVGVTPQGEDCGVTYNASMGECSVLDEGRTAWFACTSYEDGESYARSIGYTTACEEKGGL